MFVTQFKTAYMCINNCSIRPMCCHCDVVCLQGYNRSVFKFKDHMLGRTWQARQSRVVTIGDGGYQMLTAAVRVLTSTWIAMSTGHGANHPCWCRVQTVVVHCGLQLTKLWGPSYVRWVKAVTVFGYFTATFVAKNKINRKYVHLFGGKIRLQNKTPKNKKRVFRALKTKKKTKLGRPLHKSKSYSVENLKMS